MYNKLLAIFLQRDLTFLKDAQMPQPSFGLVNSLVFVKTFHKYWHDNTFNDYLFSNRHHTHGKRHLYVQRQGVHNKKEFPKIISLYQSCYPNKNPLHKKQVMISHRRLAHPASASRFLVCV